MQIILLVIAVRARGPGGVSMRPAVESDNCQPTRHETSDDRDGALAVVCDAVKVDERTPPRRTSVADPTGQHGTHSRDFPSDAAFRRGNRERTASGMQQGVCADGRQLCGREGEAGNRNRARNNKGATPESKGHLLMRTYLPLGQVQLELRVMSRLQSGQRQEDHLRLGN